MHSTVGYVRRMSDFLSDIQTLRSNARANIEKGPITEDYGADRERVIAVLNEALATELVCVLRYKRHYYMADGHQLRRRSPPSSCSTPTRSRATPTRSPRASCSCRASPTSTRTR